MHTFLISIVGFLNLLCSSATKGPLIVYRRGALKFWPLKNGGPGVIAALWRGALQF